METFVSTNSPYCRLIFYFLWDHCAHSGYSENVRRRWGGGGDVCSLAHYIVVYGLFIYSYVVCMTAYVPSSTPPSPNIFKVYNKSIIKSNLRFSIFCLFSVFNRNLLDFGFNFTASGIKCLSADVKRSTKTCLFKYTEKIHLQKMKIFR